MLLTAHGPALTIAERVAAQNMGALQKRDYPRKVSCIIDLYTDLAEGMPLDFRHVTRDTLLSVIDNEFARDKVTLGEAVALQHKVISRMQLA